MSNFAVLLDTCVLYPPTLCDLILRIAERRVFQVRWSDDILSELHRVLIRDGVPTDVADKRLDAMRESFPMSRVDGYQALIEAMTNEIDDRHVLAAAVRSDAQALNTFNLRDFPRHAVAPYDLEVLHPDRFLVQQLDLHPGGVVSALRSKAAESYRPPVTEAEILGRLRRTGLPDFVDEIRRHL